MDYLVLTLARINRYGEPSFGLRKAVMRIARFLTVDLANAPDAGNATSRRVRNDAINAGSRLTVLLFNGWKRGGPSPFGWGSERPRVDDLDIANAALDILLTVDERGNRDGAIPGLEAELKQFGSDPKVLAEQFRVRAEALGGGGLVLGLAILASDRRVFGGGAAPNSPADAVACKAFTIAVQMADHRVKSGLLYRFHLKDFVLNTPTALFSTWSPRGYVGSNDYQRVRRAMLAILILGGFADAEEAKQWVGFDETGVRPVPDPLWQRLIGNGLGDRLTLWETMGGGSSGLFDWMISNSLGSGIDHERLVMLRNIQDFVAGPARGAFAARVAAAFALIKKRTDDYVNNYHNPIPRYAPVGGQVTYNTPAQDREEAEDRVRSYRMLLQQWEATKPDWDPLIAEPLCPPKGATPRIVIFAIGVNGRIMIKKLYVGVPTTLGVIFPEPYSGDEYPVKVRTGGGELTLMARPLDDQHLLFETERFVINSK